METRIRPDAIVWIDHETAIVTDLDGDGARAPRVECLSRGAGESGTDFEARAVDEVMHETTVAVAGPVAARLSFERRFVAVTHRPDRIIDVDTAIDAADVAELPARRRLA